MDTCLERDFTHHACRLLFLPSEMGSRSLPVHFALRSVLLFHDSEWVAFGRLLPHPAGLDWSFHHVGWWLKSLGCEKDVHFLRGAVHHHAVLAHQAVL